VHPVGAFDTTQLRTLPFSVKLSQFVSLKVKLAAWTGDATNANPSAALASAALVRRIRDRIMCTPSESSGTPASSAP
jgi:hypothetical protein